MASQDNWTFLVCLALLAVLGIATAVLRDAMVKVGFYYPLLWTVSLCVFQSSLVPVSWCTARNTASDEHPSKSSGAPLYFYPIVSSFAYVSLACTGFANGALPTSILQLMKAVKLVTVTSLSVTFLGKRLQTHQTLGICLSIIGIGLIVFAAAVVGIGWASRSVALTGFGFAFVATVFQSLQNVWEEDAMKRYDIAPDRLTGIEGVVGAFYGACALVGANLLGIENTSTAVEALGTNSLALTIFLTFLLLIPVVKFSARAVTAHGSAIARALVEVGRTFAIWIVEIMFHWDRFSWAELCGYMVVTLGTMVYSKLVCVPFIVYHEGEPLLNKKKSQTPFEGEQKVSYCQAQISDRSTDTSDSKPPSSLDRHV